MDHINALRDNTIALFDTPINRLEEIIAKLDKKMVDWRNEQLEKERLAKEKAEVEAREKERLEKERLRKEAEEKEAEAKRAEEAAKKAEKNGDHKKAQEKIEEAQEKKEEAKEIKKEVKEVVVEAKEVKTKTKANGLHFRKYWKGEIIDENKLPREFLMPNVTAINEYIEKNKESAKIPGVRIYSEERSVA